MGSATPSIIWSRCESPEEPKSPPSLIASVCDGLDAEPVLAADVTSPFESVVVCEEGSLGFEVVVTPVASATGTSTESAVTVVVDVGPELSSVHMNMTAEIGKLSFETQWSSSELDGSGLAHA